MRISTLPVYSKLADEQDIPPEIKAKLPAGWRLSAHQVATCQALKNSDADVVFNVAMTGDGELGWAVANFDRRSSSHFSCDVSDQRVD
jgi:hypothetical protein